MYLCERTTAWSYVRGALCVVCNGQHPHRQRHHRGGGPVIKEERQLPREVGLHLGFRGQKPRDDAVDKLGRGLGIERAQ